MDSETSDADAMIFADAFDVRRLAGYFDQGLASVPLLIDIADFSRRQLHIEGEGDGMLGQ